MKILLVGSADTIFFVNYVSSLKDKLDAEVHVYSPFPSTNNYSSYPYDSVYFEKGIKYKSKFINTIANLFIFLIYHFRFIKFLKKQKQVYDIIHFHRILPSWVVVPNSYKKYCKKMVATFWGGEIEVEKILLSHKLYLYFLKKFVKKCDFFINSFKKKEYVDCLPNIMEKAFIGSFGSSIIDKMSNLNYSKEEAKAIMGIPNDKITVLLGYSGKQMHRHCDIIDAIVSDKNFSSVREKLHIILSMTRAGNVEYCKIIENKLENANIAYTTIKGKYSSDDDVATLRLATDIVFQLSDFDGLSASIKESLCAGSILISGKWLNYISLKEDAFKFYDVDTFESGIAMFYVILKDFSKYSADCYCNKNIGRNKYSWDVCIKPWAEAYEKMLLI